MRRNVRLSSGLYKDAFGPILGFTREGGIPVAILPGKVFGYHFTDPSTGRVVKLNKTTEKLIDEEGVCFYRPLPQHKLTIKDLLLYMR